MEESRTEQNIKELNRRGYFHCLNLDLNEDEWFKGTSFVSVHTIRGSEPEYFKSLLNQKEQYQFEMA